MLCFHKLDGWCGTTCPDLNHTQQLCDEWKRRLGSRHLSPNKTDQIPEARSQDLVEGLGNEMFRGHIQCRCNAHNDKTALSFSVSPLPQWSCRWPTSSSTVASLYHAGLFNAWCRLSRVPLTHLGPYLPPSRSLEKSGKKYFTVSSFDFLFQLFLNFSSRGITSYLSPWLRQKATLMYWRSPFSR